jgi:hypothetical protein
LTSWLREAAGLGVKTRFAPRPPSRRSVGHPAGELVGQVTDTVTAKLEVKADFREPMND